MSGDEEWGPWIEHDGGDAPPCVFGKQIHVFCTLGQMQGRVLPGADPRRMTGWNQYGPPSDEGIGYVVRYRIRKPRGLTILENLIADLPAPVQPSVNA